MLARIHNILSIAKDKSDKRPPAQKRADDLFRGLKVSSYRQSDRMFAWLIAFEWLAAMAAASLISPKVLPGDQPLQLVVTALALAGMLYLFPLYLALRYAGHAATRHAIAASQMLTPALFIYLTGGGF